MLISRSLDDLGTAAGNRLGTPSDLVVRPDFDVERAYCAAVISALSRGTFFRVAGTIAIAVLAGANSTACNNPLDAVQRASTTPTNGTAAPTTVAQSPATSAGAPAPTATPTASASSSGSVQPSQSSTAAGSAIVLPFTGLSSPAGVAIGFHGAVYVTDTGNNRVVMLDGSSYKQTVLGFENLNVPTDLSEDGGNVLAADSAGTHMLWKSQPTDKPEAPWQAVSDTEWTGPFTGLSSPHGVVYSGTIYFVVDTGANRVLRWQRSSNTPEVVPFSGLNAPHGMAWTYPSGDTWVADTGNNRVLRLETNTPGSDPKQTVLEFTGLNAPQGVAVDRMASPTNEIYVTDTGNNRVLKLTIDPTSQTATQSILPFAGLNKPTGISLDGAGNLYVVDSGNNRVLKLEKAFLTQ